MRRWAEKIEKFLIRFVVLTMVAIVVVQGLMTHEPYRLYLSLGERLEGERLEQPVIKNAEIKKAVIDSSQAFIIIRMEQFSSLPEAVLLVNDKEVACFEQKEIKFSVTAGDTVEIDSTYYNFPINYHITAVSENMNFPEAGKKYTGNSSIVMIGKVIVK
ncbi:MAG: hypothetical protein PHD40_08150 [Syntrophomonadaceae bacterium]|nr:hypothetical protein [Syntrophomonadaceae bacterium]